MPLARIPGKSKEQHRDWIHSGVKNIENKLHLVLNSNSIRREECNSLDTIEATCTCTCSLTPLGKGIQPHKYTAKIQWLTILL